MNTESCDLKRRDPAPNGVWELDKPTLNPSINCVGSWHGWIRAGRAESC